jgi:hypothetical protein
MIKITNIGCDPEFFIQSQGKHICAIPYLGGACKELLFPMMENNIIKEGFFFCHDRASVEFNVPPTMDFKTFRDQLNYAKQFILHLVNNDYNGPKIEISEDASAFFNWDELTNPKALEVGCHPSWNAWTNSQNKLTKDLEKSNFQCAAFHWHLECDFGCDDKFHLMMACIRAFDLFLGVPSVMMDNDLWRKDSGYGLAGQFREMLDKNRFEYRVLSNFILFDDVALEFMWNQMFKAIDYVNEFDIITGELGDRIQKCINTSDKILAYEICKEFKIEIPVNEKVLTNE